MKVPFDKEKSSYIYVLVRKDLPLSHQAPQAIHAAIEASRSFPVSGKERLVMLQIDSKDNLEEMELRLENHGILFKTFFEPDHDHGKTALCTSPIPLSPLFKKLKLWHPVEHE